MRRASFPITSFRTRKESRYDQAAIRKINGYTYPFQELLGTNSSPRIDTQLHFGDLLVNVFHEMNDKVNKFMPEHFFGMEISDEETDIITLNFFAPEVGIRYLVTK